MNLGVDGECGNVYRPVTLDHLTLVVDEDEVGGPDVAEVHPERIDPEVVSPLGIASGDVAGHPFVKTKFGEQTEGGGQALLAVQALGSRIIERHLRR